MKTFRLLFDLIKFNFSDVKWKYDIDILTQKYYDAVESNRIDESEHYYKLARLAIWMRVARFRDWFYPMPKWRAITGVRKGVIPKVRMVDSEGREVDIYSISSIPYSRLEKLAKLEANRTNLRIGIEYYGEETQWFAPDFVEVSKEHVKND